MYKISIIAFVVLLLVVACRREVKNHEYTELFPELVQPIQLQADITYIDLHGFMPEDLEADSVLLMGSKLPFYQNHHQLMLNFDPEDSPTELMPMDIFIHGIQERVMLRKSRKENYLFLLRDPEHQYKEVSIAGEMNGWVPSKGKLSYENGFWGTMLTLDKGSYQYKLVVDGQWINDPNPKVKTVDNGQGGVNSLLEVGQKHGPAPRLFVHQLDGDTLLVLSQYQADTFFVLWQNKVLPYRLSDEGMLHIGLPLTAKERSFIRVFAYNDAGTSNDLLIPLYQGSPIIHPAKLKRTDYQANIIYNVFIDRFADGDTSNNKPLPYSLVLPKANFNGGDLKGLLDVLDQAYFDSLGINSLWISPLVKNTEGAYGFWPKPKTKFSAYHGYWPVSFTQISEHFGNDRIFQRLVKQSHAHHFNILVDYVANHVHEEAPLFQQHPEYFTDLVLPDGTLNLEKWDEYRLTTWFDRFLPTMDLSRKPIADMLSDSIVWWVQHYHIDGFRYDAAKHIPLSFWRLLTRKLKERVPDAAHGHIYQLGETYGSPGLISSYISNKLLDAQFDFNVYDAALATIAGGADFRLLKKRLEQSLSYYGAHNLMGYITGNQDRGRFISYAGGSLHFGEDAKKAGWTRRIDRGDSTAFPKLAMLMAFNMSIPGVPVIYYGDEFGMPGGNDPDNRRMMRFGNQLSPEEKTMLALSRKLIHHRKNNMALLYGDYFLLDAGKNYLAIGRKYMDNYSITLLNNSAVTQTINLTLPPFAANLSWQSLRASHFISHKHQLQVELEPYSFECLSHKMSKL